MTDIEKAEEKIVNRLRDIDAALHDLSASQFAGQAAGDRLPDPRSCGVHRNRVAILLLNLYHLKDDARGLARKKGLGKNLVDDFCDKSNSVALCVKAGDTYKHGVGGRDGNNTVIEYEVVVCEQKGPKPEPSDSIISAFMLIVDENGEPHQSDLLAQEALWDWIEFLEDKLGMNLPEWREKWRKKPLPPGHSIYVGPLPPALLQLIKDKAAERK